MSDPQDLLYTNNFISTNILTDKQLSEESNYYDRFKNYIDNEDTSEVVKYIDDDANESSPVNLEKTLNTKWPIYSNKNHYPLFDTYINDISTNRYKKEFVTKVNIDSLNRNVSLYPNSNSFLLPFSRVFNNVKKVVINDIIFPNVNQSVSNVNNNLSWQYGSSEYLISNNIDLYIIPVPNPEKRISYSSLPNSVYSYTGFSVNVNNFLVYQSNIMPGFYTISNLISNIRSATSLILHGSNGVTDIGKITEQPYIAYPKRVGTPHLFSCSIEPVSSIVRFVNRVEEVKIVAMQTFSPYDNNFSEDDIFYYYSSQYITNPTYTLDTSLIYIIVPFSSDVTAQYYKNINCIYSPNAFPLVITDLTVSVGNIDASLINYTEFYDIQIYLTNGYTESDLNSISYYKYIDTITFNSYIPNISGNIPTVKTYLRFGLKLSTGNLNGNNYNVDGKSIIPGITSNVILSETLNNILKSYSTVTPGFSIPIILTEYKYINNECLIGRALLFRWIYDMKDGQYITYEFNTDNEKKISLLHILGWPIANTTEQIFAPQSSNGYRFVHTNFQSYIINQQSLAIIQYSKLNNIPSIALNLQYIANNYYFVSSSYVYLKINFESSTGIDVDSQFINAVSANGLLYNQVYIDNLYFDVGIGQDYTCLKNSSSLKVYKKDQSSIFAKIILSNTPGNFDTTISNIVNNNSFYIYYNSAANNIDTMSIGVYDSTLKLLSNTNNFSFTLDIHEVKDVLKETLINTKTNNVNSTGNFI